MKDIAERLTQMVGGEMSGAEPSRSHHGVGPAANPGGAPRLRREPASSHAALSAAVATRSQARQAKEPVLLKTKFDQNAIPLDEEF